MIYYQKKLNGIHCYCFLNVAPSCSNLLQVHILHFLPIWEGEWCLLSACPVLVVIIACLNLINVISSHLAPSIHQSHEPWVLFLCISWHTAIKLFWDLMCKFIHKNILKTLKAFLALLTPVGLLPIGSKLLATNYIPGKTLIFLFDRSSCKIIFLIFGCLLEVLRDQ